MLFARSSRHTAIAAALAVLTVAFCSPVDVEAQNDELEVLILGSSLSRGIKGYLGRIARSLGEPMNIKARACSRCTLNDHVTSSRTLKSVSSRSWDFVVLQEQGAGTWGGTHPNPRYPDAMALAEHAGSRGARVALSMTWRNEGEALATYDFLLGEPGGTSGYLPLANMIDADLARIGIAFRNAQIEAPELPLWKRDGRHASRLGRYLAAAMLYATLTGRPTTGAWFPGNLAPEIAAYLQSLADATALDGLDLYADGP